MLQEKYQQKKSYSVAFRFYIVETNYRTDGRLRYVEGEENKSREANVKTKTESISAIVADEIEREQIIKDKIINERKSNRKELLGMDETENLARI